MELRPLAFEAQFLKDHLNAKIQIDKILSVFELEEMENHVKDLINSAQSNSLLQQEYLQLPDFGSDHELQLAKIANKYKSHDTNPLKLEIYTNVYNSEIQRLEILNTRLEKITKDIIIYQRQLEESERIKSIFHEWIIKLDQQIQKLTDRILDLRKLRNNLKKECQPLEIVSDDDDGYYTPVEDSE